MTVQSEEQKQNPVRNLVLRTLLGNLFPGTLPGTPLLANPFLETFFATFSSKPVPWEPCLGCLTTVSGTLAWEPCLGTCSWEPGLGIVPGNFACEPVAGKFDWKSCSWGWLKTPSFRCWGKTFPSKFPGRGSQAGIQEEVPKQG